MQNIFITETDNPGFPIFSIDGVFGFIPKTEDHLNSGLKYHNVYITSDEPIEDGDYGVETNLLKSGYSPKQYIFKMDPEQRAAMESLGGQKSCGVLKIVLSTDDELIQDGVQEAHQKFIDWIVKNPGAKTIGVFKKETPVWAIKRGRNQRFRGKNNGYRVRIPREIEAESIWNPKRSEAIKNLISENKRTNGSENVISNGISLDKLLDFYDDVIIEPGISLHAIIRNAYNNGMQNMLNMMPAGEIYSSQDVLDLLIRAKIDNFDSSDPSKFISDESVKNWFNKNKK